MKTIEEILLNYRSLIADLVEDRHNRKGGISTEELEAIDNKAIKALSQLIDQARLDELESVSKAMFIEAAIKARIENLQNRLTKGES